MFDTTSTGVSGLQADDSGDGAAASDDEFVIFRPFVPFSTGDERTQLQAYMTASSDPETYGELTTYIVTNATLPDGPLRVASNAESQEEISRRISLDNTGEGGTEVRFGDLQVVPVGDGLIYVRPYYVSVPQNSGDVNEVTELQPTLVHDFPQGAPRFIQKSRGFKATIVNGAISLLDGELTGNRAGEVLRHSA